MTSRREFLLAAGGLAGRFGLASSAGRARDPGRTMATESGTVIESAKITVA
jgi:hypothetical protein